MSKKVLVLSSSPRRGGNSDLLADQFISGAQEAGHQTEKIILKDKRINYCTGCGTCQNEKKPCPQKDDMAEILKKMIEVDVITFATPVYFYTMCAQLKTFIDRCCSRYTEITGKEFYFIVTAADKNEKATKRTLEEFRGFMSCLKGAKEKTTVSGVGAWGIGDIKGKPAMKKAFESGRRV